MAWGTITESAYLTLDANFEFFTDGTDAIVLALNPRETASITFNVDAAGTTDDLEIEILQGHILSTGNGLDVHNGRRSKRPVSDYDKRWRAGRGPLDYGLGCG